MFKFLKYNCFSIGKKIKSLFSKSKDFAAFEKLLYEADLGVAATTALVEKIKKTNPDQDQILEALKNELLLILKKPINKPLAKPLHIILVVGANGSGKTTSVAKLCNFFEGQNKSVLIAAADTFRAAAVEQLEKLKGLDIIRSQHKSDPSAVVYDAISAALSRKKDILIIDTAGRLHTKQNLMMELEKIKRVCNKLVAGAPHETLLVLDATIGQNAIDQAKTFDAAAKLSGIFLSKLDGTAKGGIVIAIQKELSIPVKFIGTGENREDLELFDPVIFTETLLS